MYVAVGSTSFSVVFSELDFCSFVWRALIFGLDYFEGDLFLFKRGGGVFCLLGFLD